MTIDKPFLPEPEQEPSAADVIHVLIKTTHHFNREFEKRLSSMEMPIPLSGPRLRLLIVVGKSGQIRMNVLADKLGIQARTVTDLVDALERDGLIIRTPDPTDRRATLLKLTNKAEVHLEPIHALQAELAEKMMRRFSPGQRRQLQSLLLNLLEGITGDSERR